MSDIKQIEPKDWVGFLRDFSARNADRRARFQIFHGKQADEEGIEYFFENISLQEENNAKTVFVSRVDRSKPNSEKIQDTITNVTGIAVQYDTDGSEDALEITDKERELIMLRFESKVDGVS